MAVSVGSINQPVIIGGGVAGLSAAIRLTELGARPLLIDAGSYPSHKVCGEFFSGECIPLLQRWGLAPCCRLKSVRFHLSRSGPVEFPLPHEAGSCSRFQFDKSLADCALSKGVEIQLGVSIADIRQTSSCHWELQLGDGRILATETLLLGVGRLAARWQRGMPSFPYVGFKAHFENLELGERLEMALLPYGYVGFSQIEAGRTNVAILLHKNSPLSTGDEALTEAARLYPRLKALEAAKRIFPEWLSTKVPEFGVRSFLHPPGLFPIGDAAAAIPPIAGDGIAMGLLSGAMAAEFAARNDAEGFRLAWRRRFCSRLKWAMFVHRLALRPSSVRVGGPLLRIAPPLLKMLYLKTREKPSY